MINLFAGPKGGGKTRNLINLANDHLNVTDGYIVYIDDNKRNMHEINRKIRLVDTSEYPLSNYREFVAFVYGMISQNRDIQEIFIDGLCGIIEDLPNDDLEAVMSSLTKLSDENDVEFFVTLNCDPSALPAAVKGLMVKF
ncbi:MAG: twitching motility protein PilT [Defluviitaleaceae bacterium]|nr:twitching motility protein PilT [Defluviitaleaceae bacterium]